MFYSHEILTSPEHGVATIWLVATLGSKSITKRLNRRTILDVDVPKACNVIMDPSAPMALRLQGNLLYGVSRVYNQQCGYALTDVQTMHDRMRTMLRAVAGGGLNPMAGKARPDQLVLPYDPSFIPENDLPGMSIDLSKLLLPVDTQQTQESSILRPSTPDLTQSILSRNSSLQLSFSSGDIIMRDVGGFGSETDIVGSAQRSIGLTGMATSVLGEEQGVLLQPDFEFDEDGNIIELGVMQATEARRREASRHFSGTPTPGEGRDSRLNDFFGEDQPLLVDEDINTMDQNNAPLLDIRPSIEQLPNQESMQDLEIILDNAQATMRQTRAPKVMASDDQTALRNSELAQLNSDYVQNMASVWQQKQQNKIKTLAKKNAAFWVFGQGIGSVGVGVGTSHFAHPLLLFSGQDLFDSLNPVAKKRGHKRGRSSISETEERRVRAREEEYEEQVGRGEPLEEGVNWQEDVEIGRRASILHEEHSSQMPWNITASIQSSRHPSSANLFRGLGSVSDFSSRGLPEDQLLGHGRSRSRLTSASPLAGRGFPFDIEALNIPGNENMDLEDFDLSHYLQTELYDDDHANGEGNAGTAAGPGALTNNQLALRDRLARSNLDQESLNFLEFLTTKIESLHVADDEPVGEDASPPHQASSQKEISFSTLLPRDKTSPAVATHGLMHILTLATKGFLSVYQGAYEDLSTEEHGAKYESGEIFLRLAET